MVISAALSLWVSVCSTFLLSIPLAIWSTLKAADYLGLSKKEKYQLYPWAFIPVASTIMQLYVAAKLSNQSSESFNKKYGIEAKLLGDCKKPKIILDGEEQNSLIERNVESDIVDDYAKTYGDITNFKASRDLLSKDYILNTSVLQLYFNADKGDKQLDVVLPYEEPVGAYTVEISNHKGDIATIKKTALCKKLDALCGIKNTKVVFNVDSHHKDVLNILNDSERVLIRFVSTNQLGELSSEAISIGDEDLTSIKQMIAFYTKMEFSENCSVTN